MKLTKVNTRLLERLASGVTIFPVGNSGLIAMEKARYVRRGGLFRCDERRGPLVEYTITPAGRAALKEAQE